MRSSKFVILKQPCLCLQKEDAYHFCLHSHCSSTEQPNIKHTRSPWLYMANDRLWGIKESLYLINEGITLLYYQVASSRVYASGSENFSSLGGANCLQSLDLVQGSIGGLCGGWGAGGFDCLSSFSLSINLCKCHSAKYSLLRHLIAQTTQNAHKNITKATSRFITNHSCKDHVSLDINAHAKLPQSSTHFASSK